MTEMIYAIVVCVVAGGSNYCHLVGEPFVFRSADQCIQAMSTRLGPGNLIGDKFYTTAGHSEKVWYECDQRPTSDWAPVSPQPSTSGAAPFKHVPYVLRHCVGARCEDSSVPSVSEEACATASKLARQYDASGSYECVKK